MQSLNINGIEEDECNSEDAFGNARWCELSSDGSDYKEAESTDDDDAQVSFQPITTPPRPASFVAFNDDDSSDSLDEEEEFRSATFIMNQKSLADKAPGAQQHSFAHRHIGLKNSAAIRTLQFASIFLIACVAAGIPYGFPALRQLLVENGVYGEYCSAPSSPTHHSLTLVKCRYQEARLAVLQVAGWCSYMISGWAGARAVQRLGPRTTGMIGSFLIAMSCWLLALSLPPSSPNAFGAAWVLPIWARQYLLPVILMSFGSANIFLACLHYVRLFPKRTSFLHSIVFLGADLSAIVFDSFYEARDLISLRLALFCYAVIMAMQTLYWRIIFSSGKIPTIRFTVTTWHQKPLLADQPLQKHIASPFFWLGLLFILPVFGKIFFYLSTFQIQLCLLLMPRKRSINHEDFLYEKMENSVSGSRTDSNPSNLNFSTSVLTSFVDGKQASKQLLSYVPFFAEQPGGTASTIISLRQFIYNPAQPEIFLTDLQEMLYLLIPGAACVTIFWMRSSMTDRKISTALLFSLLGLIGWGIVQ